MLWKADESDLLTAIAKNSACSPIGVRVWRCPCGEPGCDTMVAYAKNDSPDKPGAARPTIWFASSVATAEARAMHGITEEADLETMLGTLPEVDRIAWSAWLQLGLRKALLAALAGTYLDEIAP